MTYPAPALATAFGLTVFVLTVSACGSTSGGGTDFDAAFTCDELADRWQDLQQDYLDRLGDASSVELEEGSARVDAAGRFIAQAMQEQARDVELAGCAEELVEGGPVQCRRVDALVTAGAGAARIVEALTARCPAG